MAGAMTNNPDVHGHIELYLLFDLKQVARILSKDEFESLLDGEAPLSGFSGTVEMAQVVCTRLRMIQSMVCFNLPLDNEGYCQENWHMPLQRLADTAARGPNLGAGRIRLACSSQCAISWHKDSLWEPSTTIFSAVKKAVSQVLDKSATAAEDEPLDVDQLKRAMRNETQTFRTQLQSMQQEVERQRLLNERLQKKLAELNAQEDGGDKRIELQMLRLQNQSLLQKVRELEVRVEQAASAKQVYIDEDEIEDETSADQLLDKMQAEDILCVVYRPGVGHLNLSPEQMVQFLDDPLSYSATQAFVSLPHYKQWLKHHDEAKCKTCGKRIPVIAKPKEYRPAEDDFCAEHKPA